MLLVSSLFPLEVRSAMEVILFIPYFHSQTPSPGIYLQFISTIPPIINEYYIIFIVKQYRTAAAYLEYYHHKKLL